MKKRANGSEIVVILCIGILDFFSNPWIVRIVFVVFALINALVLPPGIAIIVSIVLTVLFLWATRQSENITNREAVFFVIHMVMIAVFMVALADNLTNEGLWQLSAYVASGYLVFINLVESLMTAISKKTAIS